MKRFFTMFVFLLSAFSLLQAQVTVQAGAEISTTNNAVIVLQDIDLLNNGNINQAAGDGLFVFNGNSNTSISGSGNTFFDKLEVAKLTAAKVSLLENIHIVSNINFTSGFIDLNSNNILLQPSALLNGENENSRIIGAAGGYIEITNTLTAPIAFNAGNMGAVITSSQNLGATVIRRGHVSQKNSNGAGSSILRYYDIMPTNNNGLNATLRINYFDAELNGLDENLLILWKSPDKLNWIAQSFSTRNTAGNFVEKTGVADFSRWTLSTTNNALPITLISFNVQCDNGNAILFWKTEQEQNSNRFEVQKSIDGIQWQTAAVLPAAGNSTTEKSYTYTDDSLTSEKIFYRIKEVDFDGKYLYTTIKQLDCGNSSKDITLWPNPVQQTLNISIISNEKNKASIKVFDSKGANVHVKSAELQKGNNMLQMNLEKLPAGVYTIKIYFGTRAESMSRLLIKN